jgi:hypothetical protein
MDAFDNIANHFIEHAAMGLMTTAIADARYLMLDASNGPISEALTFTKGIVVNEVGGNFDTRFEGDTDQNLLFLDASTDRVGIGVATPTTKLSVVGTDNNTISAISSNTTGTGFVLQNTSTGAKQFSFFSTGSANGFGVGNFGIYNDTNDTGMMTLYGADGDVSLREAATLKWGDATYSGLSHDTGITRNAAGVVEVNNGTNGTLRDINLRGITTRGASVFNEDGGDFDTRIEGDTDTNLLLVDASTDRVGIGIAPDGAKLHVKATTGSIAKFGDGGSDARFELLRDTGGGAEFQFHAGIATMTSDGHWQLKHNGTDKIKIQNNSNGMEVWIDSTTPSIYTGGGDDFIIGRNQIEMIKLVDGEVDVTANLDVTGVYKVDGVQVITNRVVDARCDDAVNSGDATTDGVIDALRDAMITHGLIAAA